ncbi:MAG TPA: hypothetical protein VIK89_11555, partial [Cytophagaceae bacterium]
MREEFKPGSDTGPSSAASSGLHQKIAQQAEKQEKSEETKVVPEDSAFTPMTDEMHHWVSSEAIKMEEARKRGYTDQFVLEGNKLKSLTSNELFTPDQVTIVDHFRFEGTSDPDYMSILFLIKTENGRKGTVT